MFLVSWDNTRKIKLNNCPFCGGEPSVKHLGNDYTRKRIIEIKCGDCRATKRNATLKYSFEWLEDVAIKDWNQRPMGKGQ